MSRSLLSSSLKLSRPYLNSLLRQLSRVLLLFKFMNVNTLGPSSACSIHTSDILRLQNESHAQQSDINFSAQYININMRQNKNVFDYKCLQSESSCQITAILLLTLTGNIKRLNTCIATTCSWNNLGPNLGQWISNESFCTDMFNNCLPLFNLIPSTMYLILIDSSY